MCYVMLDHNDYMAYGAVHSVQYCILQHVRTVQLSTVQYSTVDNVEVKTKRPIRDFLRRDFPSVDRFFFAPNKKNFIPHGDFLAVRGIFERSLWGEKISGERKFPRVGA